MNEDILTRHRAVYARVPREFNYSTVGERLMAGRNPLTAHDIHTLLGLGVTHLIDLRQPHEWTTPKFGLEALREAEDVGISRRHIEVEDMGAPTQEALTEAVAHIEGILGEDGTVAYIHCRAGMERTAAILIAFHAKKYNRGYEQSLEELRRGRGILNPLPNQERAVRLWLRNLASST